MSAYRPGDVAWMSRYYQALVSCRDAEALEALGEAGLPREQAKAVFREDCQSQVVRRRRARHGPHHRLAAA